MVNLTFKLDTTVKNVDGSEIPFQGNPLSLRQIFLTSMMALSPTDSESPLEVKLARATQLRRLHLSSNSFVLSLREFFDLLPRISRQYAHPLVVDFVMNEMENQLEEAINFHSASLQTPVVGKAEPSVKAEHQAKAKHEEVRTSNG